MLTKTKITIAFLALALIPFALFMMQEPAVEQENDIALHALQLENEGKKQLESQLNEKQGAVENLNQFKQTARKPKVTTIPSINPQAIKPTPSVTATPSATPTATNVASEEKNTGKTPEFDEKTGEGEMGIQEFDELNEINNFDWSFEDIEFGE